MTAQSGNIPYFIQSQRRSESLAIFNVLLRPIAWLIAYIVCCSAKRGGAGGLALY